MDSLLFYFLPVVVIIIVWTLQRKFRTKKTIEKIEDESIESNEVTSDKSRSGNRSELEIETDTKLLDIKNEEDCNSTSSSLSEYVDSVSTLSSLVCRYECTETQDMKLTPNSNEEGDYSYMNNSSSEYMDSLSTMPSTIYSNDYSTNEIQEAKFTSRKKDYYPNDISSSSSENLGCSSSDNMGSSITQPSGYDISTSSSENLGCSSSDNMESSITQPSGYDNNDDSVNIIQCVEDFSDVGLHSTATDENDIDDNMNNGFIEVEGVYVNNV